MKTAVEWLIDMLVTENEITLKGENYKLFEQAKEMEKQQIIEFHIKCMEDGYNIETYEVLTEDLKLDIKAHAEQYYKETYKSE